MLKLNVNQEKQLTFDIEVGGVQTDQLEGFLRITIDKIQYGFPAVIGNSSVSVDLPPLKSVTSKSLKEAKEVDVKLEIVADGNYLVAWEDTFRLVNPLTVEAKIVDSDFKETPKLTTKLVQEGKSGDKRQKVTIEKIDEEESKSILDAEEALTERIVDKLAKMIGQMSQTPIEEKCKTKVAEEVEEEEQEEIKPEPKKVKEEKRVSKEDMKTFIDNLDKKGIYEYMKRAGTKTQMVQDIIYDQAQSVAKSTKPIDVLREVIKILKKG